MKNFLDICQKDLLAAELQLQEQNRARVGGQVFFQRYYVKPTPEILKDIQEKILSELSRGLIGDDYFQRLVAPCQEKLMTQVIPSCLAELAQHPYRKLRQRQLIIWLKSLNYPHALIKVGSYYLKESNLLTSASHRELVAAGTPISGVVEGLYFLKWADILTQNNYQILQAAKGNIEAVIGGLKWLSEAGLLTQRSYQVLVAAGENTEEVAKETAGFYQWQYKLIKIKSLLVGTVSFMGSVIAFFGLAPVLYAAGTLVFFQLVCYLIMVIIVLVTAIREGIIRSALYDRQLKEVLIELAKFSLIGTTAVWLVSALIGVFIINPITLLFALAAMCIGTGIFLGYRFRLHQLILLEIKAATQALAQAPVQETQDPLVGLGRKSAFNTLSGFANYYRSFLEPKAYSKQWYQGFVEGCRQQMRR